MTETAIHHHQFDPRKPTIFGKTKSNERAQSMTIYCTNADCPLLAAGQCVFRKFICPYGRISAQTGPTKRAAKLSAWLEETKVDAPQLTYPANKMAFIGDYVYLPYAHMDMCEKVPFLSHSAFIISGNPFLPREHWTVDTVETLVLFRPQAMMGGEIKAYQRESVPLFVQHLRELDPGMFAELVKRQPQFDTAPDYVGRKALLRTLATPIEWVTQGNNYPVHWKWDGESLSTSSIHAYHKTWGRVDAESVEVRVTPKSDAVVEVKNNAWVVEETVLVD